MTPYKIGQLLYIIANKSRTIEPVQVVSKQTVENLQGTSVQHVCENVDGSTFSLEDQNEKKMLAGVFETVEEAESHLLSLAAEMVHSLADAAREKARKIQTEPEADISSRDFVNQSDVDSLVEENTQVVSTVNLPDGTTARARIHFPPELQ